MSPIVSIPLWWPLSWPRDPGAPSGRYEDWLLWAYAHRRTLAEMFADPPAEDRPLTD